MMVLRAWKLSRKECLVVDEGRPYTLTTKRKDPIPMMKKWEGNII